MSDPVVPAVAAGSVVAGAVVERIAAGGDAANHIESSPAPDTMAVDFQFISKIASV